MNSICENSAQSSFRQEYEKSESKKIKVFRILKAFNKLGIVKNVLKCKSKQVVAAR